MKGLRDIIAHHYFEVDADQIWWIIENELQPLKKAILEMIESLKRMLDEMSSIRFVVWYIENGISYKTSLDIWRIEIIFLLLHSQSGSDGKERIVERGK